jgi:hypothetical protein
MSQLPARRSAVPQSPLDSIEEFARAGRTILYTTHYMEEAERLCDRVAIMDQGKILALDTVDELLRQHGGPSTVEAEVAQLPDNVPLPATLEGNILRFACDQPFEEANRLRNAGVHSSAFTSIAQSRNRVPNLTGRGFATDAPPAHARPERPSFAQRRRSLSSCFHWPLARFTDHSGRHGRQRQDAHALVTRTNRPPESPAEVVQDARSARHSLADGQTFDGKSVVRGAGRPHRH